MRVLVTGSRDWEDEGEVWDELSLVLLDVARLPLPDRVLTVVHGNCPEGVDRFAHNWAGNSITRKMAAAEHVNFYEERHPANWRKFGKQAGFKRNAAMVGGGADLCLAFLRVCTKPNCIIPTEPHGSHGGSHTAALARAAGIETRVFKEGW